MRARTWTFVALGAVAALSACRSGFRLSRYPNNQALYDAGLREFQRRKWGNAIQAFEKLTTDLPARDTLLPRAFWYLGTAHRRQREHLLAAQSFTRLYESFLDDSLADDAALEAARSYRTLWRKPGLDPTYGETALSTYNTMLGLFPTSDHADRARTEVLELEQWFATKNFETGRYYYRRKAYDSAIIYLKTVLERWPHVPRAKDALVLLADAYRQIRYRDDFNDTCARLKKEYPGDQAATKACVGAKEVPADSVSNGVTAARPPNG